MLPEQLSDQQKRKLSHLLAVKVMGWEAKKLDHNDWIPFVELNPLMYLCKNNQRQAISLEGYDDFWEPFEDANQALMVLRQWVDVAPSEHYWLNLPKQWLQGPESWLRPLIEMLALAKLVTRTQLEEALNRE